MTDPIVWDKLRELERQIELFKQQLESAKNYGALADEEVASLRKENERLRAKIAALEHASGLTR